MHSSLSPSHQTWVWQRSGWWVQCVIWQVNTSTWPRPVPRVIQQLEPYWFPLPYILPLAYLPTCSYQPYPLATYISGDGHSLTGMTDGHSLTGMTERIYND